MTTKSLIMVALVALVFSSCEVKQDGKAKLQIEVDSLVALLQDNKKMSETLLEADALLDSIDASRNVLRAKMREGISSEDFTSRIKEIGAYIKRSVIRIHDLEVALHTAKQSGSSYSARINNFKESLEKSSKEIIALQNQVAKYQGDSDILIKTVNLQQAEIEDKLSQIATREEEVAKLEVRISEILVQSRIDEAEAYFARAEALELAAIRTNFAPKKKRTTREQALEMYRMAVLYGKDDAKIKVDELVKKL